MDNNFLAVLGTGNPGSATLTLAANENTFGFTWGSVDTWNTLTITDSRGVSYSITGSDILAQLGNPTPGKQNTQTDISFTDPYGKLISAQFASTDNAFEAGNFSETSATPLPSSALLFGTALMGLAAFAYRRRVKA